jgi:hypothetical protein
VTPRHPDTDRLAAIVRAADPDCFTQSGIVAARLLAAGLRLPAEPGAPDRVIAPHADTSCKTHHGPPWPCAASQPVPTPEPPAEPDYNPHPNPFDENGDFLDGEFDEDGNPASVPEAVTPDLRARLAGTLDEVSFPLPNGTRGVEMRDALVAVDAALDATPPPALDVERLTQAYTNIEGAGEWTPNGRIASGWVAGRVAAIAREYARLATSTDNH